MATFAAPGASGRVVGCIVGSSAVCLWGLSSHERLRRLLARAGITQIIDEEATPAMGVEVVCLRADHLFEERTIVDLAARRNVIVVIEQAGNELAVAAHVNAERMGEAIAALRGGQPAMSSGIERLSPKLLSAGYTRKLRKFEPPRVLPIREGTRDALEQLLFDGSYKGVTDAVTKWLWPRPARWVTGLCARAGIRPNHVTTASLALVIAVTFLFAGGYFTLGLFPAWLMTFLDTVDGKLARVTIQSTTLGHVLDHGMDIVHPPFWYLAWGIGLGGSEIAGWPLSTLFAGIIGAYVLGRLVELAFTRLLGISLFCWRPFDSYLRLVVARRNPCLVLLTGTMLLGRPDWGLLAVAMWTVVSTLLLFARLMMGGWTRWRTGSIGSWLAEPPLEDGSWPRAARPFVGSTIAPELLL